MNNIKVFIPYNKEFLIFKDECKALYENVQNKICDTNNFEFIIENTFFYLFVNNQKLIGAIYFFEDNDKKLYLNGFSYRKMHLLNLECLKMSLNWFACNIYAIAQNKMSKLCLKKCGFECVEGNEFMYKAKICGKS